MSSYCLKCRKNAENINPKVLKTSNGKIMLLSKCDTCGSQDLLNSNKKVEY